ncbi:hypothetical protein SELMODRAFT_417223 [Selaginella moellendorffii]|uniref:Uncharacterized protein n=1 Tax=Selaginella moellendorffii TaxID=88036 RepID=D8S1S3_SELML|nr:hypothetical protein SELMODRAFT_417223 [Selaginella moellendorffii]
MELMVSGITPSRSRQWKRSKMAWWKSPKWTVQWKGGVMFMAYSSMIVAEEARRREETGSKNTKVMCSCVSSSLFYIDLISFSVQADVRQIGEGLLHFELEAVSKDWCNGHARIAPVVTLVQSSGWGKSRTVCELANRGVFVVYCSFASASGSTYPPRSAIADFFYDSAVMLLSSGPLLVSQSRFMLFCMDYFESCIDTAMEMKMEPEAFLQEVMLEDNFWGTVKEKNKESERSPGEAVQHTRPRSIEEVL